MLYFIIQHLLPFKKKNIKALLQWKKKGNEEWNEKNKIIFI